jgi:hypothetical protein
VTFLSDELVDDVKSQPFLCEQAVEGLDGLRCGSIGVAGLFMVSLLVGGGTRYSYS